MLSDRCVLIYSGGLDSTVLLYHLMQEYKLTPHCLTFNYGQRHRREINCAREICSNLGVVFSMVDLTSITRLIATGSQVGKDPVPIGRYDAENMKTTIVPNRNMVMLSIAVATAIKDDARGVYYAAHSGDHAIYPDCREEFINAMQVAVCAAVGHENIRILAPFRNCTKAGIVTMGRDLKVPFKDTHSCYLGMQVACGRCGTCVERLEAFHIAGIEDPLDYVDREYWRTVCQTA